MVGGYKMLDLSDYTLSGTSQTVTGLYQQLVNMINSGKPVMVVGMHTATDSFGAMFPFWRYTATQVLGSFVYTNDDSTENYIAAVRVTSADALTIARTDVTNVTP